MNAIVDQVSASFIKPSPKILLICPEVDQAHLPNEICEGDIATNALGIQENQLQKIHFARGEKVPVNVDEYSGIVIASSIHSVNDDIPWVLGLHRAVESFMKKEIPMVGICFGHQLIANVLGGTVRRGDNGYELGITRVLLTDAGKHDRLFADVPKEFETPTNHGEVVTKLPDGSFELAYNDCYRNQAFLFMQGNICAYGVQFHPEKFKDSISSVVKARAESLTKNQNVRNRQSLSNWDETIREADLAHAKRIMHNFIRMLS